MEDEKAIRRHKLVYRLAKIFAAPAILAKYSYTTDDVPVTDYPCIIMANHTTEVDMLMVGSACSKFMYFVCGEHLLRSKYAKLIVKYFDPITEFKGAIGTGAVREILRRTKAGYNVMIFPEGSRSFNGETVPLSSSIGKLVKKSGAGLVTYHMQGGYFIAPRWAYTFRKGPASGKVVHVYSPDDLKAMSVQEVTDIINTDLYENAYDTQRKAPQKYTGERLAEGIENYLLICPECGAYDSLESHGNEFSCTCCGKKAVYTEEGFLDGDFRYDSVYDWGKWVAEKFAQDQRGRDPSELLFTETDVKLYKITPEHEQIDLMTGTMTVYSDRLEFEDKVFPFAEMPTVSMLYYGKTLLFTFDGTYYGITGEHFHASKCSMLYDLYTKG